MVQKVSENKKDIKKHLAVNAALTTPSKEINHIWIFYETGDRQGG